MRWIMGLTEEQQAVSAYWQKVLEADQEALAERQREELERLMAALEQGEAS